MSDRAPDASARGEEEWRRSEYPRWGVLDPAGEPKDSVYSTVYVQDELLFDPGTADSASEAKLRELARLAGWDLGPQELEDPYVDENGEQRRRSPGASRSMRLKLTVADSSETGVTAETPDAWQLLRQARRDGYSAGVSLNHVLSTDSMGLNPFKANPFKANPFKANPFKANPFKANAAGVGIDSYASPGFGGRQPVSYLGPVPARRRKVERRPAVAVFDTGLGEHPWFGGDVRIPPVLPSGEPIGITRASTDPEVHPSLALPLDGIFDDAAGHGTFIAGIALQGCPDAQILPVRVADGEGTIVENELIGALGRLIEFIEGGTHVDVLNLSFSYYSETPDDLGTVSEMATLLARLRELGVVVVCSAGNEATDRPTFPAALPVDERHLSVGALNPTDASVALFSNIGPWVDVFAPGVSLVSTLPVTFNGGIQAGTRDDKHGRRRETLDVDDFAGGFAVWSGTSFAAPVVAGRLAQQIAEGSDPDGALKTVVQQLRKEDRSRMP